MKEWIIINLEAVWAKFISAVRSAPAVYAYGVATGIVLGWVFL